MRTMLLLCLLASAAWGELKAYKPEAFSPELLQKAESGDPEAQCKLAGAFRDGRGVEKNPAESLKWLQRSAGAGFGLAELMLAKDLLDGTGLPKDPAKAEQLLLSAEQNVVATPGPYAAKIEYLLGMFYVNFEKRRDLEKARKFLKSAAEKNDSCAQHVLARLYEEGWGVEKNEDLALDYLKKSAADSPGCGKALLGEFYLKRGRFRLALEWFEKADAAGEPSAALQLGYLYRNGKGTPPDLRASSQWFEKAARQGDFKGKYEVAKNLKMGGEDVEAVRLFQEVADGPVAPEDPEKNFLVGVAALEAGRFAQAKEALQRGSPINALGARSLRPDRMRRTAPQDPTLAWTVEILDESHENIGSGVLVGSGGKVLTAAHVVAENASLFIRDARMKIWKVLGLWVAEPHEDLALLQTDAFDQVGAALATTIPQSGDTVTLVGHPAQVISVISSVGTIHQLKEGGARCCSDAGAFHGFSGSGVYNDGNELVGVVIASYGECPPVGSSQAEPSIHTSFESLPRLQTLLAKSEDETLRVAVEQVPGLKTYGIHWDRDKNNDTRNLAAAKIMLDGPPEQAASAVTLLGGLAGKGNAEAQALLGLCYRDGRGVPVDTTKAAEHFLLAANQGNSCAKHHLGMLYLEGVGVLQDDAKALEWLEKAARDDPACGKLFLGIYYHRKNDLVNALHWYRLAREQGDGRAESYLAQIRSHRPEVPKEEFSPSP